jgi:large subunit ribosomal protein L11
LVFKTPPASVLLKKAAGIETASGKVGHESKGKVTKKQVEEIAKTKLPDLNCRDLAAAIKIVEGTARSSGIKIEG